MRKELLGEAESEGVERGLVERVAAAAGAPRVAGAVAPRTIAWVLVAAVRLPEEESAPSI